jgi:hypothetical protein
LLQKRGAYITSSHVRTGQVPGIEETSVWEPMLLTPASCSPRVVFGCTLEQALGPEHAFSSSSNGSSSNGNGNGTGSSNGSDSSSRQLAELVRLYSEERYMLTWHDGTAWVLVQEGAKRRDLMRALWQAAWLEAHVEQLAGQQGQHNNGNGSPHNGIVSSNGSVPQNDAAPSNGAWPDMAAYGSHNHADRAALPGGNLLAASLEALQRQWPDFAAKAEGQGWLLDKAVLPQGTARLRLE